MNKYSYGNLIYDRVEGWLFVAAGKEEKIEGNTLAAVLNIVGKKGWELVLYDDKIGYIFKLQEKKDK